MTGISAGPSFLSRVMIFIDGEYFEKRIREKKLTDGLDNDINYSTLANFLSLETKRRSMTPQLIRTYYYNASASLKELDYIEDESEKEKAKIKIIELMKKQESKFDSISVLDSFDVRKGRLVYTGNGQFRQKGVDTLIAIDMLSKAHHRHYDQAVLVAGDSDFVEVVKAVKETGVHVTGAYFCSGIQKDLIQSFDKHIKLDTYDLIKNRIVTSKSQK